MPLVLDALLACMLPILAWRALATDDVREGVVLFVALGLLSAVVWARLGAPDIALVEAAVGTGITGALLVTTLRVLGLQPVTPTTWGPRIVLAVLSVAGALAIAGAVAMLPASDAGLGHEVRAAQSETGIPHPVTAVLLDFRGYDTLLEVAVLLVALLAVRSSASRAIARDNDDPTRPLVAVLVRVLVPGIVLVAGYLLWRGAAAPGGAFQAAAVLAGGGILMILAGTIRPPDPQSSLVRWGLVLGPGVFVVIAAVPLATGAHVLEYPTGWTKTLILVIEVALTFSIALVLMMFFPGSVTRSRAFAENRA